MNKHFFIGEAAAPCNLGKLSPHRTYKFIEKQGKPRRQRGIVLFITLIALVAMTLAAIALTRSVDTGNVVAGNLAFKQGATLAGDAAVENAIIWLQPKAGTATVYEDIAASGYYATSQDTLDILGNSGDPLRARVDWDNNGCNGFTTAPCISPAPVNGIDAGGGYTVKYIIHRLCQSAGNPNSSTNTCATYIPSASSSDAGTSKGEIKAGDGRLSLASSPTEYYRITSRILGPRNTISFIEVIVHF